MGLKDLFSKPLGRKPAAVAPRESNRLLPLREASQIAYDEVDGSTFPLHRGKTTEERLESMATILARHAPIIGAHPPSEDLKPIAPVEFAKGKFTGGGDAFRRRADAADTYVRLSILEADLRKAIHKMCSGG